MYGDVGGWHPELLQRGEGYLFLSNVSFNDFTLSQQKEGGYLFVWPDKNPGRNPVPQDF